MSALDELARGAASDPSIEARRLARVPRRVRWSLAAPPWQLLARYRGPAWLWAPRGGDWRLGLGVAHRIALAPHAPLDAVVPAARAAGLPRDTRWVGGLGFADADEWPGFGRGCFVAARHELDADGVRSFGDDDELAALLDALAQPAPATTPARAHAVDVDGRAYCARVLAALRAIAAGEQHKLVLARATELVADGAWDVSSIAAQLPTDATRYLWRDDGATLLGATPEGLVARSGDDISTEAVAGTAAVGDELATEKNLREHAWVVEHLRARLSALCDALSPPAPPSVRQAGAARHLATPIRGRLRAPLDVMALAARLHPTPAVAGVPARAASAWLRRHEGLARGWYAGPFGWFDAHGDGELVVALRCALVDGRRATLFSGAGIVAGSDPEAELAETRLKERSMRRALGVA